MAKCTLELQQDSYQEYIADNVRLIGQNTARLGGSYYSQKWKDLLRPATQETRTAGEIKQHMKDKLAQLSKQPTKA